MENDKNFTAKVIVGIILVALLTLVLFMPTRAQTRINEVYAFTLMPDGNNVIGIAKRSDGIMIRNWDIHDFNNPTETSSFKFKDSDDMTATTGQYKISTSGSGEYVAIAVRPDRYVTRIHVYKTKNGNLVTTIKTDKLFENCRHQLLTLEFSKDDKYLYFSDLHGAYKQNIGGGQKQLFKDKRVVMVGYDIDKDMPIITTERKNGDGHVCPNKKDVYIVNGDVLSKVAYESVNFSHNKLWGANDITNRINLKSVDKAHMKNYLISNRGNKFLALTGGLKIIEIYVTL